MWISDYWEDFGLIDAGNGYKLERWKDVYLLRPDPQAVWKKDYENKYINIIGAKYFRSQKGGGEWKYYKKLPDDWIVKYRDLKFKVRPTGFKHTGLFPEQAVNWDFAREMIENIKKDGKTPSVLNLFAYTGGATVACLKAGAEVCHLDASKSIVTWAKENVALNGLSDRKIRYIVDDADKFVRREIKRGNKYDGIIMDPPSYGRGPNGELWKIEDKIYELISSCAKIISDSNSFMIINTYTTGLSPSVIENILRLTLKDGMITSSEIGFKTADSDLSLPCGSTVRWQKR